MSTDGMRSRSDADASLCRLVDWMKGYKQLTGASTTPVHGEGAAGVWGAGASVGMTRMPLHARVVLPFLGEWKALYFDLRPLLSGPVT